MLDTDISVENKFEKKNVSEFLHANNLKHFTKSICFK